MQSKQIIVFLFSLVLFTGLSAQKIVMKINGITSNDGEPIKALEFKMDAESSWTKGGGVSVGKPDPGNLLIKKDLDSSTAEFFNKMILGKSFPEISFEYLGGGSKPEKTYIITIYQAFLTQLQWLTPECPGCLSLEHQVGFVFKKIKTDDPIRKKVVTWDVSTGKVD